MNVHGKKIAQDNFLWESVPKMMTSRTDKACLQEVFLCLSVCPGHNDEQFASPIHAGSVISHPDYGMIAYHEGNYNAHYNSTIISVSCALLIEGHTTRPICRICVKYRNCLQEKTQLS